MVGAGQLARMTHQAAIALGQSLRVLAVSPDDPAAMVCPDVVLGEPGDAAALRRFLPGCDVVTFDHEGVPTEPLASLAAAVGGGVPLRPGPAALLHNDYRLDNCLLDIADPARIVAVIDWDMCTQGDPLADLGYLLNYWVEPDDPEGWRAIAAMPTWRDGFPTRSEAVERYAARTGFDVGAVGWYQVFAAFKLAVIIQQIYIRYVRGQTQDRRFEFYWRRVLGLAKKARGLAGLV